MVLSRRPAPRRAGGAGRSVGAALTLLALAGPLAAAAPASAAEPLSAAPAAEAGRGFATTTQVVQTLAGDAPVAPAPSPRAPSDRVASSPDGALSTVQAPPSAARFPSGSPALSTWAVTYSPGFPASSKAAVQAAVDTWSRLVSSPVPIRINLAWSNLPPGVLGQAGPALYAGPGLGDGQTWFPAALADRMLGGDIDSSQPDIDAAFDSDAGVYSTNGGRFDLTTVALHEIGHGLGFVGSMEVDALGRGSFGEFGGSGVRLPFVYDRFGVDPATGRNLLSYGQDSAELGTALRTATAWNGARARQAYEGRDVPLFAPSSYDGGSSFSHLDEAAFPAGSVDALLTPSVQPGEVLGDPGDLALGMLADMGWGDVNPERRVVRQQYRDFLDREPDAVGLVQFSSALRAGSMTRLQVAQSLADSDEYVRTSINRLYLDVFQRDGDSAGLSFWVDQYRRGKPLAVIAAEFYGSEEYFIQPRNNRDLRLWVTDLYDVLLERAPDDDGLAFWVARAQQLGRAQGVAVPMYGAPETLLRRVEDLYEIFLRRSADPAGLSTWPPVVGREGDLSLSAFLASSEEYFQRAQSLAS